MEYTLIIGNIRDFNKADWSAYIIDGIIIGLGTISEFVDKDRVKLKLEIGKPYKVTLNPSTKSNKLICRIEKIEAVK